jgi:hypothetical protein
VHEECRRRTVDIVAMLRHWRRRRVGEILRSTDDDPRKQQLLPYAELVRKGRLPRYGGLLTDVPAFTSVKQLERLAGCKPKGSWRTRAGGVAERAEAEKRALAWQEDDASLKPEYGSDSEEEDEGDKPKPKADTDADVPADDGDEAADAEKAQAAKIKARDTAEAARAHAEVRSIAQAAGGQQVWIFFHDGGFGKESCRNAQTGEDGCGWGYWVSVVDRVQLAQQGMQDAPASFGAVCHGPVITDTAAAAFSGCIARTNNTAELSAVPQMLARACRYQRDKRDSASRGRRPPPPPLTLIFCYDSQYTHDTCVADAASPLPRRNCTIVALCRRLLADAAQLGIAVAWVKVRGHSTANPADMTVVGNNRADKAADRGQEGKTCGEIAIAMYMRWELGR